MGFATNAMFLRDALDKAGVQAQFIARGEYKSAANLFTQDGYTDAHREADSRLIESLHAQVLAAVADSRHIEPAEVDALADQAPLLRDAAVEGRLVDRIGYRDEAYGRIAELVGAPADSGDADGPDAPPRLYLSQYPRANMSVPTPPLPGRKSKPTIAVVTLAGPIVSGRGGRQLSPFGTSSAGGDTIAAALREAGADDAVSAVVLRVDSPGGSVTASETMWREVNRLREAGKPVVASMGAVAASGGYYVSMSADAIVANPGTITGSIGVVTGKLVARDLKDRLGIGSDSVRTNPNADAWSLNKPFTDEQHAHVEAEADLFYTDFVQRVAQGRNMTVEDVDAVARGRVWTGADALERGLGGRTGRAAHRDRPRQGARGVRRRHRRQAGQSSRLVVGGHAATQAVVATCRGVPAGSRCRPGGPIDRRRPRPDRAIADRGQRAVAGGLPVLTHCYPPWGERSDGESTSVALR